VPTYSYRCTQCDTAFDIQQAFTDNTLTECPTCGGKLRKVYSSIGVSFTGSGFYRNDSRSEGKSNSLSAEKSAAKSETAPAAKPAEKSSPATPASSGSSSGGSSSSSSSPTPAPKSS